MVRPTSFRAIHTQNLVHHGAQGTGVFGVGGCVVLRACVVFVG